MIAFLCCSTTSFGMENDYDFRKAKWGMTKEEVKSTESNVYWFDCYANFIYFDDVIKDKDGKEIKYSVGFYFYNGKLYKGEYNLINSRDEEGMYNDIVESYKEKYIYEKIKLYDRNNPYNSNYFYNKENTEIKVWKYSRENIFKITFVDISIKNEIEKKEREQYMLELKKKEEMIKRYKKEISTKF